MSWSFKPGDRVVCVDAVARIGWVGDEALTEGRVYTVAACFTNPITGNLCFYLVEQTRRHFNVAGSRKGYAAWRFRPVRAISIDCLRAHLNTKPADKRVDA